MRKPGVLRERRFLFFKTITRAIIMTVFFRATNLKHNIEKP